MDELEWQQFFALMRKVVNACAADDQHSHELTQKWAESFGHKQTLVDFGEQTQVTH